MVKRFKVWRVELLELDEGEMPLGDEDCEVVVFASDYDALAADVITLDARVVVTDPAREYTAEEMHLIEDMRTDIVWMLGGAFTWDSTPQGAKYWADVVMNLEALPDNWKRN